MWKKKNAKPCNVNNYKTLQNGWKFFKSTPLILAFQPFGKGISGKELLIVFAFLYIVDVWEYKPVTKFTPSIFIIGTI